MGNEQSIVQDIATDRLLRTDVLRSFCQTTIQIVKLAGTWKMFRGLLYHYSGWRRKFPITTDIRDGINSNGRNVERGYDRM